MPENACRKILIADDSRSNQQLLAYLLEALGCSVDCAENGEIAVEKALENHYAAILMDINMPVIDGVEATKMLRQINYRQPIIACTAEMDNDENKNKKYFSCGFDGYLSKPVDHDELLVTLRQTVGLDHADFGQGHDGRVTQKLKKAFTEKISELKPKFERNIPNVLAQIETALANNSVADIKGIAHRLKGMAANYGYPELANISKNIELALKKGQLENAFERVERLMKQLRKIARASGNASGQ